MWLGQGLSRARFLASAETQGGQVSLAVAGVMTCGERVNGSGVLAFDEVIPLSIWKEIVRCYCHGHCSTPYVLTALLR